jgi:hypothetical protein
MSSRSMMMIGMVLLLCLCKKLSFNSFGSLLITYSEDFLTEILRQR